MLQRCYMVIYVSSDTKAEGGKYASSDYVVDLGIKSPGASASIKSPGASASSGGLGGTPATSINQVTVVATSSGTFPADSPQGQAELEKRRGIEAGITEASQKSAIAETVRRSQIINATEQRRLEQQNVYAAPFLSEAEKKAGVTEEGKVLATAKMADTAYLSIALGLPEKTIEEAGLTSKLGKFSYEQRAMGTSLTGGSLYVPDIGGVTYTKPPEIPSGMVGVAMPSDYKRDNSPRIAETPAATLRAGYDIPQPVFGNVIQPPVKYASPFGKQGASQLSPTHGSLPVVWTRTPITSNSTTGPTDAFGFPAGFSLSQDIDTRYQAMLSQGKSIFAGDRPNDTVGGVIWGAKVALLDFPAIELTKMTSGFVTSSVNTGYALRYGDPSVTPYIGLTQSIAGTKPFLTSQQTKTYLKAGGQGTIEYFQFPVTLTALGAGQRFVSGAAVGSATFLSKAPVIAQVSSAIPFRVGAVSLVKTATSPPVLFGALSAGSMYSMTKGDVPSSVGAGLGVYGLVRGYQFVGEQIIKGNQAATPEAAYNKGGIGSVLERNFVQTVEYKTPEAAAKFYAKASPQEFVAALAEGSRYGSYQSRQIPKFRITPLEGEEAFFPRIGEMTRNPASQNIGFSAQDFQFALAKQQGRPIPSKYVIEPIEGLSYPSKGQIVPNTEYADFMRASDFRAAIRAASETKPSFVQWAKEGISSTVSNIAGTVGEKGEKFYYTNVFWQSKAALKFATGGGSTKVEVIPALRVQSARTITPALAAPPKTFSLSSPSKVSPTYAPRPVVSPRPTGLSGIKFDIASNQKAQTRIAPRQTVVSQMVFGVRQEIRLDTKSETLTGLKTETRQDIRQELKNDLRQDLRTGLRQDLKQDVRTNLRTGLKQSLRIYIPQVPKLGLISAFDFRVGTPAIGKSKSFKGEYQPSFISTQFNIRGKAGKSEMFGFALRPVTGGKKKR
jgi:hypothetical protein